MAKAKKKVKAAKAKTKKPVKKAAKAKVKKPVKKAAKRGRPAKKKG